MITNVQLHKIVSGYIGVEGGYLGDFSYRTHAEFYPIYCELDIDPYKYEGTTRERFIHILTNAPSQHQAKILEGVLKRFPLENFSEEERAKKSALHGDILTMIEKLKKSQLIGKQELTITSDVVEKAINDAKVLIETQGATSGIDRIHTVLHGYLKAVSAKENITLPKDANLTDIFKALKVHHPALSQNGSRAEDVERIFRSFSTILDSMNPLRNRASVAHANDELLEEDEAYLVINVAQTILNYIDAKIKTFEKAKALLEAKKSTTPFDELPSMSEISVDDIPF